MDIWNIINSGIQGKLYNFNLGYFVPFLNSFSLIFE